MGSEVDYDATSHRCTTMLYSADGSEVLFCGTNKQGKSFLVEWKIDVNFSMARSKALVAMGMIKWFDNNFNYSVLEVGPTIKFSSAFHKTVEEYREGDKIYPLMGTTQLYTHLHYIHGIATSSRVGVNTYISAQNKKAMDVTHYLWEENYVFWGGLEGYQSLLNTEMERELAHLTKFLESVVASKMKIGFNETLLIEPKPQEPTKHQYDWDVVTTTNFLRDYRLLEEFKLNIECNHATLFGHTCHHHLDTLRINGLLGNIDSNTGDPQLRGICLNCSTSISVFILQDKDVLKEWALI